MEHHAYLVAGPTEEGRAAARSAAGTEVEIIELDYGLFSVDDARELYRLAWQRPARGEQKAIVISAGRMYHEAQNALLKLFEEPPADTILYLCVPAAGSIIPTLRSRLLPLPGYEPQARAISEEAQDFIRASKEKRSVLIKKLADAQGEEKKRAARSAALSILDGVEAAAYEKWEEGKGGERDAHLTALLGDISLLRAYLQDRSAPLRMILEHVSLTLPKGLTS